MAVTDKICHSVTQIGDLEDNSEKSGVNALNDIKVNGDDKPPLEIGHAYVDKLNTNGIANDAQNSRL